MINKFFQPPSVPARKGFFTTIPIAIGTTSQITGPGLSLSYDMVHAQGGEIQVFTKENVGLPAGAGTEFIIQLPFKPVG